MNALRIRQHMKKHIKSIIITQCFMHTKMVVQGFKTMEIYPWNDNLDFPNRTSFPETWKILIYHIWFLSFINHHSIAALEASTNIQNKKKCNVVVSSLLITVSQHLNDRPTSKTRKNALFLSRVMSASERLVLYVFYFNIYFICFRVLLCRSSSKCCIADSFFNCFRTSWS